MLNLFLEYVTATRKSVDHNCNRVGGDAVFIKFETAVTLDSPHTPGFHGDNAVKVSVFKEVTHCSVMACTGEKSHITLPLR